jgi:transposase
MRKQLVTDELWKIVGPLLAEEAPKLKGGRPRVDDRAALTGIIFVLKNGIPWEMLPQEEMVGLREYHGQKRGASKPARIRRIKE